MTSAHVMKLPILGRYLKSLGCFQSKNLQKDREESMAQMQHFTNRAFHYHFPRRSKNSMAALSPSYPKHWSAHQKNECHGCLWAYGIRPICFSQDGQIIQDGCPSKSPMRVLINILKTGRQSRLQQMSPKNYSTKLKLQQTLGHSAGAWPMDCQNICGPVPLAPLIESLKVSPKSGNAICCTGQRGHLAHRCPHQPQRTL